MNISVMEYRRIVSLIGIREFYCIIMQGVEDVTMKLILVGWREIWRH